MSPEAKKPLGRGLSALLGEAAGEPAAGTRAARAVAVASIRPNDFQPRRTFTPAEMNELIASVRTHGVLQPILVRRDPKDANRFELIAGERRWRAAQAAQLHEIPAVVRDLTDREALELALIENLQREDLTAIEEARAYRRLMTEFGHNDQKIGDALGKSRSHVANTVRLLELPDDVQKMIERSDISAGHGRLLVGRADATLLASDWVRGKLSVRAAEQQMKGLSGRLPKQRGKRGSNRVVDANTADLERRLTGSLGVTVRILHKHDTQSGVFQVHYSTLDQLDDIIERISGRGPRQAKPENWRDGLPKLVSNRGPKSGQ